MENKDKMTKTLAFIGSYADAKDSGLYVCSYDEASGSIELMEQTAGLQNPTFLDVNADTLKLYAITEGVDANINAAERLLPIRLILQTGH